MDIPEFIFSILEKELLESHLQLLEKIADHYGFDIEEMKDLFLPKEPMKIVPQDVIKVQVKKCYKPRVPPPEEERCMARVWNHGLGGHCIRHRCNQTDYCRSHQKGLKYGRMDEPAPDVFRPPSMREGYHSNLR